MIRRLTGRDVLIEHIGSREAEIVRLKAQIAEFEQDVASSRAMLLALGDGAESSRSNASFGSGTIKDCILAVMAGDERAWKAGDLRKEILSRFDRRVTEGVLSVDLARLKDKGLVFRAANKNLWFISAELAQAFSAKLKS